jgi:hypothetical protein
MVLLGKKELDGIAQDEIKFASRGVGYWVLLGWISEAVQSVCPWRQGAAFSTVLPLIGECRLVSKRRVDESLIDSR